MPVPAVFPDKTSDINGGKACVIIYTALYLHCQYNCCVDLFQCPEEKKNDAPAA